MGKVPPLLLNKITIVVSKQNVIGSLHHSRTSVGRLSRKTQVINQVIDHHLPAVY
jgi:hypothetical protein